MAGTADVNDSTKAIRTESAAQSSHGVFDSVRNEPVFNHESDAFAAEAFPPPPRISAPDKPDAGARPTPESPHAAPDVAHPAPEPPHPTAEIPAPRPASPESPHPAVSSDQPQSRAFTPDSQPASALPAADRVVSPASSQPAAPAERLAWSTPTPPAHPASKPYETVASSTSYTGAEAGRAIPSPQLERTAAAPPASHDVGRVPERPAVTDNTRPQASPTGTESPRPSWNEMRERQATMQPADSSIMQKAPIVAGAGVALLDRPTPPTPPPPAPLPRPESLPQSPVGRAAGHPEFSQTQPQPLAKIPSEQPSPQSPGRSPLDITKEGKIAEPKNGGARQGSVIDKSEPGVRPGEIKPEQGQIAYGATPDGKQHPFGLVGRPLDGKPGDIKPGEGRGGDGIPPVGFIGQIFDGKGTLRPPEIKLPGGKQTKGDEPYADDKKPESKTAGEALVGIIESVKSSIKFGPTDKKESPKNLGDTTKPDRGSDKTTVSPTNKVSTAPGELVLTGVVTKPRPLTVDGTQTSVVAILAPFLSGGNAIRITTDIAAKADAPTIKTGRAAVKENDIPLVNDQKPPQFFEQGKLKSRPSVNLHLPNSSYANKQDVSTGAGKRGVPNFSDMPKPEKTERIDRPIKQDKPLPQTASVPTEIPNTGKPWLNVGNSHVEVFDDSATVDSMPALQVSEMLEPARPAKAIDEAEITLELEVQGAAINSGARFNESGIDPREAFLRLTEAEQEPVDEASQSASRYQYVVKIGDSVESVSRDILKDISLAALLFKINRRYVMPEEVYGIHPLVAGATITLPTPVEILKFKGENR